MALLDPPVVSLLTTTRTSVAFDHQIAAFADTTEVQLYNTTDQTTDFNGSFGPGSINIDEADGLLPNKRYVAIFQSKNSSDEFSSPVITIPFFSDFPGAFAPGYMLPSLRDSGDGQLQEAKARD